MRVIKKVLDNESGIKPYLVGLEIPIAAFHVSYDCDVDFSLVKFKEPCELYSENPLGDLVFYVVDNAGWNFRLEMTDVKLLDNKLVVRKQVAYCSNTQVSTNQNYSEAEIVQDLINLPTLQHRDTLGRLVDSPSFVRVSEPDDLEKLVNYIKTDDLLWDLTKVESLIDALDETEIDKLMEIKL